MVNISRNEVNDFQYATTLDVTAQAIVPAFGTASANITKRIKITDIKASVGGSARTIRIVGEGGSEKQLAFNLPANSTHNFTFELPYSLSAVSSTGVARAIYASAAGSGVDIVICGYVDYYG